MKKIQMPNTASNIRLVTTTISRLVLLSLAASYFAFSLSARTAREFADDYAINWTAAKALTRGASVYDNAAMRRLALEQVGNEKMRGLFSSTYSSFIGLPSTALLYLPFTVFDFNSGLWVYRVTIGLAMVGSVWIASLALPQEDRLDAISLAAIILLSSTATHSSLQLGQVDGWIMVGIGIAIWGASKGRWTIAGIGIAVAALLKISPLVIAVYLLMRGKWQAALSTALSITVVFSALLMIGRGNDLITFATVIFPAVSQGTLWNQNQSGVAWIGRIVSSQTDFISAPPTIDPSIRAAGMMVLAMLLFALWIVRRGKEVEPSEIALVVIAALLTAPLTWEHYVTWSVIGLMTLCRRSMWRALGDSTLVIFMLIVFGAVLIILPTVGFSPDTIHRQEWFRFLTGTLTIGLLAWLIAGWRLIRTSNLSLEARRI